MKSTKNFHKRSQKLIGKLRRVFHEMAPAIEEEAATYEDENPKLAALQRELVSICKDTISWADAWNSIEMERDEALRNIEAELQEIKGLLEK